MTSIKTLLAAALMAGSAGTAFASDNSDGLSTRDNASPGRQSAAGFVAEGRNDATSGDFTQGDADVFRLPTAGSQMLEGRHVATPADKTGGIEYRGSAN